MNSRSTTKDQEAVLVSTQDDLDKQIAQALDALGQEDQPLLLAAAALPVESPESGSSQSVRTTFVRDTDAAIMSNALVSVQDRRNRLTSLLHHLTVNPLAPDQELPMAGLPAVGRRDVAVPTRQQRSGNAGPATRRALTGWQFARLFVVAGVTAALVGWGIVVLPGARKTGTETVQAESPLAAEVRSATRAPPLVHDSQPEENTERSVAANVQSATGMPSLLHDSLPQENTEPSVTANVQSATAMPPLVHDSLAQENTELPVAVNVQSATGVPRLVHDNLKTEPSVAANVQSTAVPPLVHDSRAQDNKPPVWAAETSPDQAPKSQSSQVVGSIQVLDADEIAALVKRGKDFATHGDLISARLLLRRAAEAGSAEAALALGETFDPVVFRRLGVIGIEPDAASARKWYQRAAELGSPVASQYLAKSDRAP
jgi:hypothetical protein